jgi:hypothetical protein
MRKLLSFAAAVIFFVAMAATAQAQVASSVTFSAEVSFAGAGTFGFDLRQLPSNAFPSDSNMGTSTNTINWSGVTVTAGAIKFVNSHTVAFITNDLIGTQQVFMYTNNTAGTNYKIHATSAAAANSFVETKKKGTIGVSDATHGFDLAYRVFEITPTIWNTAGAGNSAAANVDEISIGLNGDKALYGTGFILDKNKTGVANEGKGQLVASIDGTWVGFGEYGTYFVNPLENKVVMFFSANFEKAKKGYLYGTDTLTVETVVNP